MNPFLQTSGFNAVTLLSVLDRRFPRSKGSETRRRAARRRNAPYVLLCSIPICVSASTAN